MMVTRRRAHTGFTLIELLITTSLMAMVAGACIAALHGGITVWERAEAYGTQDQAVLIAFDQFRRDVQSARHFAPVPFEGTYEQAGFAAVQSSTIADMEELGRLTYSFNSRERVMCREFMPYRRSSRSRGGRCSPVLEDVVRVRMSYLDPSSEGDTWASSWKESHPPAAVRLTLTLQHGKQPERTYACMVPVNAAAGGAESDHGPS